MTKYPRRSKVGTTTTELTIELNGKIKPTEYSDAVLAAVGQASRDTEQVHFAAVEAALLDIRGFRGCSKKLSRALLALEKQGKLQISIHPMGNTEIRYNREYYSVTK